MFFNRGILIGSAIPDMIGNTLSMKVNADMSGCVNYLNLLPYILVRHTVVVTVSVQLNMTVFHYFDTEVFL